MTFIKQFERRDITPRKTAHKPSRGSYSAFERDGQRFIQLVTYGQGQKPNKITQTLQLDREGAHDLYAILKETFGFD